MSKRYEISLWTFNDKFVSVLASSDVPHKGNAYLPKRYSGLNGESKLSFTLPLKYYDADLGEWVTNEKWYDELKNSNSLANGRKVKLIFDKMAKDQLGGYIHKIHEYVIEKMTEQRTENNELYCEVECVGAAWDELGRVGYTISLNMETVLLDEEKNETIVTPTLDYWAGKVFPENPGPTMRAPWHYKVATSGIYGPLTTKAYELNSISNWREVGGVLQPVYEVDPIEKARFIDVQDSNKYNITQDIAEAFQLFVDYRFYYDDLENPFKITRKEVVFYDSAISSSEYAITYGNNEKGLVRTSNSSSTTTKMFVAPIESEYADDGFVSIEKSMANPSLEPYILDFDYYLKSGQLSEVQAQAIGPFKANMRAANIALNEAGQTLSALGYEIAMAEASIANLEAKENAADENINNIDDKLTAFDLALPSYIVKDTKVSNTVKLVGSELRVTLRRSGALSTGLILYKQDGTTISSSNYTKHITNYGYVDYLVIAVSAGLSEGDYVRVTYDYDLLSFYRNEKATWMAARDSATDALVIKRAMLTSLEDKKASAQQTYDNKVSEKKVIADAFSDVMGSFIKEGNWSDSNYKPAFRSYNNQPISIGYHPFAMTGEATSNYMEGPTKKYFHYLYNLPMGLDNIEDLVIVETFTVGTGATEQTVNRELKYGAQWEPQWIYRYDVDEELVFDTILDLTQSSPPTTKAYYVRENLNRVYSWNGSAWVTRQPVKAIVFDKTVDLSVAGHVFKIGNTVLESSNKIINQPYTIAHRRRFLTKNGRSNGEVIDDIQSSSMKVKKTAGLLAELDDYYLIHVDRVRTITLKTNNKVPFDLVDLNIDYKVDVSSTQYYRDALEVMKTSAYPEVTYEVTWAYLKEAYVIPEFVDYNASIDTPVNGSIIRLTDPELKIMGLKGIITSVEESLDTPEESVFTVSSYKTKFEDLFGRIIAGAEQMKSSGYLYDRVAGAFGADLTLNGSILQRSLIQGDIAFSLGQNSGVTLGNQGILLETSNVLPSGVKGQIYILGTGILASNSVNENGTRQWTTAITASGINASMLTAGRIDTELVNIYSGGQIRFTWKADGLFAFEQGETGDVIHGNFVRYNEEGLLFQRNGKRIVSLDWSGLFIGAADGSLELTGSDGFTLYHSDDLATRLPLIKLGKFSGGRGMVFYDITTGVALPSLVSSTAGEMWLRRTLSVGALGGETGITGIDDYIPGTNDPIRIWSGNVLPSMAPFRVHASGAIYSTKGYIGGFTIGQKTLIYGTNGDGNFLGLGEDGDFRLWAGNSNPFLSSLYITKTGHLFATTGTIAGAFQVGGNLSSQYFASGALGHGWRISGDGTAEFKDVYVRGTISSTVFEYKRVSSVGGALYVAPTLISITPSAPLTRVDGRYIITLPGDYTGSLGGREWLVGDSISISGYLAMPGGTTYEIADWRCAVVTNDGTNLTMRVMLPAASVTVYDADKVSVFADGLPATGATILAKATCVYLGTTVGNVIRRKGILLEAGANYSPYIDIYDDNSDLSMPKVRLGNLSGITDPLLGGQLSGYGLYSENVYLRGTIIAQRGQIGGWNIGEGALYTGGRDHLVPTLPIDATKMYLGDEGVGLGTALTYDAATDSLSISARYISIGGGGTPVKPIEEYIDEQLGYRIEVLSTSNILSSDIPEITIYTRVYKGPTDITADLPDNVFHWTRVSDDAFADNIWNNNPVNQGRKMFTLSTLDVYYSATFTCSIVE